MITDNTVMNERNILGTPCRLVLSQLNPVQMDGMIILCSSETNFEIVDRNNLEHERIHRWIL